MKRKINSGRFKPGMKQSLEIIRKRTETRLRNAAEKRKHIKFKVCGVCKKNLPIDMFYRRSGENILYLQFKCKPCCGVYQKERRKKPHVRFLERENLKRWYKKHPGRTRAYNAVVRAIQLKKLFKPDFCSKCRKKMPSNLIAGHHSDYSKPLDVIWLCPACHKNIHMGEKQ